MNRRQGRLNLGMQGFGGFRDAHGHALWPIRDGVLKAPQQLRSRRRLAVAEARCRDPLQLFGQVDDQPGPVRTWSLLQSWQDQLRVNRLKGENGKDTGRENKPVTIGPGDDGDGGNGSPTDDHRPPAPGPKGTRMLNDILRIAPRFADDLALLGKVHGIPVKAEAKAERQAASGEGCSKSKGKAKSR